MDKLVIEGELPGLNKIIALSKQGKGRYQPYAKVKRDHTEEIAWLAKSQIKRKYKKIDIDIVWVCKNRRRDKLRKIFLISGKARHGKDTVADIMMEELHGKKVKVAVAYYLKDIATRFYSWSGEKDEKGRHLMQYLGTDVIRNTIGEDFHINRLCDDIKVIYNDYDYVLVPDVRFPNEINRPKKEFGDNVVTIRVNRPGYKEDMTREALQHVSETALDNYKFDYIIDNSKGLDHIKQQVRDIVKEVI